MICVICFAFLWEISILHIPVNGHSLLIYLLSDSKWSTIPEFQHSLDAALLNACVLFKQSIFQPNLTIYGIPWQVKVWMPYKKEPWKQNAHKLHSRLHKPGMYYTRVLVAKVKYPVCPTTSLSGTPLLNCTVPCCRLVHGLPWCDGLLLSKSVLELSSAAFPRSGICKLIVLTLYTRSRISKVLISVKPYSSIARQVLWTCSMQGEKEQMRPPAK